MARIRDNSPHICKICKDVVPASGMGSHLYHKHSKMSSTEYAEQFGEFRKSYLEKIQKRAEAEGKFRCLECNFIATSHKQLVHHINKVHSNWESYYIKHYFQGVVPTCECGCEEPVKLIRHGKDESGKITYRRAFKTGHDTKLRQPGYRTNTQEQRDTMRLAAIKRLKEDNSTFHQSGPSRVDQEVADFLQSLELNIVQSDKKLLAGLEIDILIPELKLAVEYNGSHFHSDLYKKDKKYHLKKTEEASRKGYRLFHIWEPDWYTKRDIVESMLKQYSGRTETTVYARTTELKELSRKEGNAFLVKNHLQGAAVASHYLGLYYNTELVSVMTFCKLRVATGLSHVENHYELLRFCSKLNTTVVGGASKLFTFFTKKYKPARVLTYANRDWSQGNVYTKLGMTFVGTTPPGYFYVKSKIKYSRVNFQKHKLVAQGEDSTLTEYEIMMKNGYVRVWDCGNLKYEYIHKF
jgi:uncharacterized C2H2 Zn-finger protein